MSKHLFKDTKECNASLYLDYVGYEITRDELLLAILNGDKAAMLYVGGGYVPLTVAVVVMAHDDICEACSTFEDWCRKNDRLDEIGEDEPESEWFGEYECHIEQIPQPKIVMPEEG